MENKILLSILPELAEVEQSNENSHMCSTCKGGCCKQYAGIFAPEQIVQDPQIVLQMLKGDYCIDTWSGDPRIGKRPIDETHPDWYDYEKEKRIISGANKLYNTEKFLEIDILPEIPLLSEVMFLRPKHYRRDYDYATKEMVTGPRINSIRDDSWGGQCVLLTDQGCSLKFEERPRMCQILKPNYDFLESKAYCGETPGYSKREFMLAWIPYQNLINKAVDLYHEEQER